MKPFELIQDLKEILNVYNLRPQYKAELDKARKINNNINSKIDRLLYLSGI